MKYITFEKTEYNHKLISDVSRKSISSFWIYDAFQIDCDISDLPVELQKVAVELSEEVARGSWFSHIDLNQRKTMNIKVEQQAFEWVKHTFNIPASRVLNSRDKFTYNITEEDEKNSVKYIKTILLHYLQKHYDSLSEGNKVRYQKKIDKLKCAIEECVTNYDCHVIMHNHFNYPLLVVENKLGRSLPGAKWNLSRDNGVKTPIEHVVEEEVDPGPTIHTISSDVFELKWEISEPVIVEA
jgi:hypothetical protein